MKNGSIIWQKDYPELEQEDIERGQEPAFKFKHNGPRRVNIPGGIYDVIGQSHRGGLIVFIPDNMYEIIEKKGTDVEIIYDK